MTQKKVMRYTKIIQKLDKIISISLSEVDYKLISFYAKLNEQSRRKFVKKVVMDFIDIKENQQKKLTGYMDLNIDESKIEKAIEGDDDL